MKIVFIVDPADAERARAFFRDHSDNDHVRRRRSRNVEGERPALTRESFWRALAGCLLTTQQKSGPESAVARFGRVEPFPLALSACMEQSDLGTFVADRLREYGGIRRHESIGKDLATNLRWLDAEGWPTVIETVGALERPHAPADERRAAHLLAEKLQGVGPKQSTNLLQNLGLTQHEIPVDSRVTKWLHGFGFPFVPGSAGLGDTASYDLVVDGMQALCTEAGVLPCLMDAAIFSSFD